MPHKALNRTCRHYESVHTCSCIIEIISSREQLLPVFLMSFAATHLQSTRERLALLDPVGYQISGYVWAQCNVHFYILGGYY